MGGINSAGNSDLRYDIPSSERCYLIANGFAGVRASLSIDKCRSMVDPVFHESLATGGRIFTDAHRYFDKPLPEFAQKIVKRLKSKFYEQDNN